jgi:hypothetical protein
VTLTIALAIVGVLVLAALIAHSAWSSRRAEPKQALPPVDDHHLPDDAAHHLRDDAAHEPQVDAKDPQAMPRSAIPAVRRAGRLDALIDAIVPLSLDASVSGDAVAPHLPSTRRAGTKPWLIEGFDESSRSWEPPSPGHRYTEFQAGVQMANRSGALNEIEYSEFVQKVQAFADQVGALPDFPDMLDVVARARELDAFANGHDAQLTVNLRARAAAWSVGYLQQCAARHGLVAGALPGRLVLPPAEEGAPPVLVLAFDAQAALQDDPALAAVRQVSISLDVPQTPASAEPFAAWQQVARALADDMDAALVDDQGALITLHAFAAIGQELGQLYEALEARDLAAGSAVARRLFS